jgi:branched-chain amino acid transport system permease protein
VIFTMLLSMAMGRLAFRPFIGAPPITLLISSFGVLLIVQYAAIVVFGEQPRVLRLPGFLNDVVQVAGLRVPVLELVTIGAAGVVLAVFCWRFSGDWITEWPGYAVGIGVAAIAIVVQAYLMTSTPVPIVASFAMTMAAAFAVGFLVAGHLAGTQVLEETRAVHRQQRERELVRRR